MSAGRSLKRVWNTSTQRTVDTGSVVIGRRATHCLEARSSHSCSAFFFAWTIASQKEVTASSTSVTPRTLASTKAGARGRCRRSPLGGHGGAPSKWGAPSPYALPCPPSGPGRIVPPNPKQVPTETTASGKNLHQAEREDAVAYLQPSLKQGPYHGDHDVPNEYYASNKL